MKYNFVILIILFSCSSDLENEKKIESLSVEFTNRKTNYVDVFSKTILIPLETHQDCLISEVSQLETNDSLFFILDRMTKNFYCFSLNGKYKFQIGKQGRGPGEYVRHQNFILSEKFVKIYDSALSKIIVYSNDGKFIDEIRVDKYLISFGEYRNGYWGYCSNVANTTTENERDILKFVIFSENGKTIKKIYGEKVKDKMLLANSYLTTVWADTVTFVEPYSNIIYCVVNEKVIPHFEINATKHFIPNEFLKKCQNITPPLSPNSANLLDHVTKNFFFCFVRFYENRQYLYAFTPFKATSVLYDKKEKKVTEFSQLIQENSWQTFFPPNNLRGSTLYSAIDPIQLYQFISKTSENCSEMRADSIKYILKNVKPTDNPLIFGYEINKN